MSDQFWLTPTQLNRIKPHFPLSHGIPRVDDLRVVSGIMHVIRNSLASERGAPEQLMIDATHLKAHRTAASLLKKGMFPTVSDARKAA